MYNRRRYIIKKIKTHRRVKRFFTILCFFALAAGFLSFTFFGLYIKSSAIKFIAKYKNGDNLRIEKVMINPRITFEHSKNDFYKVRAAEAIHKNNDEIVLTGVEADGSSANIKAGKLLISASGENLIFSDNPVLVIKKTN